MSVGVSCAGWKVKSSSKLLASDGPFCRVNNYDSFMYHHNYYVYVWDLGIIDYQ